MVNNLNVGNAGFLSYNKKTWNAEKVQNSNISYFNRIISVVTTVTWSSKNRKDYFCW